MKRLFFFAGIMLICQSLFADTFQCDKFTCLNDVPSSYLGESGNCAVVNGTETGLEFGACGGGTGTVTKVSVVSANGLTGTVANDTSTPAITLSTSVTGILKGNGTAISAATDGTDYLSSSTGLKIDQTTPQTVINGVPKVENGLLIGTDANLTDFPKAKFVSSEGDTGHTYSGNLGVVGEATGGSVLKAIGVGGVALLGGTKDIFGTFGRAKVGATAYTGDAVGIKGASEETHAGGRNVGVYGIASGGATNYSFYGEAGDIYNLGSATLAGVKLPDIFTTTNHYSGFPNRTDTTLSFVAGASGATRTLTISGTNWKVYINGVEYTIATTLTKKIDDVTGLYWFWITAPGGVPQLNGATTGQTFGDALVATVYWNTTTDAGVVSDERHWMGRDKWYHEYLHQTVGARYYTGGALTFPTASTFQITQTEMYDEDIEHILAQATTCKVFYKNGSANWEWDTGNTTIKKLIAGAEQYNNGNALANVSNSNHFAMWVFATNNTTEPFIALLGQRQDVTLASARANNTPDSISYGALPSAEMKLLYRVIFKQGTTAPIETADYRNVSNLPISNYVATDHSTLSNLLWTTSGHTGTASTMPVFDSTASPALYTMTGTGTVAVLQTAPAFLTSISTPSIITSSGALGITPASGSNLNVTLATTGDFSVNTNQLYVDTSAASIGIGTSVPTLKLDIRDGFLGLSDADVDHGITAYAPTNTYGKFSIDNATDGGLQIWGFGDTVGQRALVAIGVLGNNDPTDTVPAVELAGIKRSAATPTQGVALGDAETVMQVYNFATPLMTILGNGKTGIGTVTPSTMLHVIDSTAQSSAGTCVLTLQTPASGSVAGAGPYINFNNSSAPIGKIQAIVEGVGLVGFAFSTYNSGLAETVRIKADGSVGIGTSAPANKLEVSGLIKTLGNASGYIVNNRSTDASAWGLYSTSGDLSFYDYVNTATPVTFEAGGNVGIGTTNPAQKLDVAGKIAHTGEVIQRVVTTTDDSTAVIDVGATDQYQLTAVANDTTFSTTGTPTAGQKLVIRFKDAGAAKNLTWDAIFRAIGVTLPTATVASKTHYVGAIYNATDTKWDVLAVGQEA